MGSLVHTPAWAGMSVAEAGVALVLFLILLRRRRQVRVSGALIAAFGVLVLWGALHLLAPPTGIWRVLRGFWVPVADRALFTLFLILTTYALLSPLFPAYRQLFGWLLGSHLGFWALITAAVLADFQTLWQPRARFVVHWGSVVYDAYQIVLLAVVLAVVGYVYRHGRARSLLWAGAAFALWLIADAAHLMISLRGLDVSSGTGLITRGINLVAFVVLAVAYLRPDPSRRAFAERYFADAHALVQRLEAQLAEMAAVQARLEERQRLARELHDSVSQALFSAELQLGAAEMMLPDEDAHARPYLARARRIIHEAASDLRALIADLRPPALAGKTLPEALEDFAQSLTAVEGIPIDVHIEGHGRLGEAEEAELYRIAYEALTNAVRHARPQHIRVSLHLAPPEFHLRVEDDGQGFDPNAAQPDHWGLVGMHERAERLGAVLQLNSAPGEGTRVEVIRRLS